MDVSLALSCGTALGLSHIGVLKFCDEHHIQIKEISGCSIGSWIGALYAIGYCGKEIENIAFSVLKRGIWKLADPTLSCKGLLAGKKIFSFISESVSRKTFEQCNIPLKIIAVNSLNSKMTVFSSGSLAHAIRASISMPVFFKPWTIKKIPYIDGGVGFPINCAILSDTYPIIASIALGKESQYERTPHIMQQIFINQTQLNIQLCEKYAEHADIVLQPDMSGLYQWSFNNIREIINRGYAEAKKIIHHSR